MGVLDGQPVNQAITNPAFINKNIDDVMPNKLGFNRPLSGSSIADIQAAVNKLYTATGASESQTGTVYGAPSNTISDGDSYQTALSKLAKKFDPATGHMHTGNPGDAPPIDGSAVQGVPYVQFIEEGSIITAATGGSTDVTTLMTGKTPSNNSTTLGVIVNNPYNRVFLSSGVTAEFTDELVDARGNIVYGRLTESSGTWTLTYFALVAGSETAYSFSTPTDIRWFYRELFAPLDTTPVYEPNFELWYKGVKSIQAGTGGTPLFGSVVLEAGQNITLSAATSSNSITIISSAGGGGGGGSLQWIEGLDSPTPLVENANEVYSYDPAGANVQFLSAAIKIPDTYVVGTQMFLKTYFYSDDTSGNVLFRTTTYLLRTGVDPVNTTTHAHTSTNSAVTLSGGTQDIAQELTLDLSDASGQLNGTQASPGDILSVRFYRSTDTSTLEAKAILFATEIQFT